MNFKNAKKIFVSTIVFTLVTAPIAPLAALAATTTGSQELKIERLGGYDRFDTAIEISKKGWSSAESVVLAPGNNANLVDALTVAPLAKAKNAPILLTGYEQLDPRTKAEIERLGAKTVYVASGTVVIPDSILQGLKDSGITIVRLGGVDRYGTSVAIAEELSKTVNISNVVIANGYANVDALSVAPIAAAEGMPILLTDKDSLPAEVSKLIADKGVTKATVIGGTGVVSDAVEESLPGAQRLGGYDRFDTNREVLKAYKDLVKEDTIFIANGNDPFLCDALAGAALAAKMDAGLVLSEQQAIPAATLDYINKKQAVNQVYILGGTFAVADSVTSGLVNNTEPIPEEPTKPSSGGSKDGGSGPNNPGETQPVLKIVETQANLVLGYLSVTVNDQTKVKKVLVNGVEVSCTPSNNKYTVPIEDLNDRVVFVGTDNKEVVAQAGTTQASLEIVGTPQANLVLGFLSVTVNNQAKVAKVLVNGTEVSCTPSNNKYTVPIEDLSDRVVFVGTDGKEVVAQAGTTQVSLEIVGTPQANLVLGYLSVKVNDQTKVAKVLVNGVKVTSTPANNVFTVPIEDLSDRVVFVGTDGKEVVAQAGTTQGSLEIVGTPQANLVLGYLSVKVNDQTKVAKVLVNGVKVTSTPANNVFTVPIEDLSDKVVFVGTDGKEVVAQAGSNSGDPDPGDPDPGDPDPGDNTSGLKVTEAKYDGVLGFLKITVNDSSLVKAVIIDGTTYTVGGPAVNGASASLVSGSTTYVKVTDLSGIPSKVVVVANNGDQVQAP